MGNTDPPPYQRLGENDGMIVRRPHKLTLINLIGTSLLITFLVLTIFVLFVLFPSNLFGGRCFWTERNGRCFWPFSRPPSVLLISMDGFRHDYLELVRKRLGPESLPNFARFTMEGVRANHSVNVYPTITMPNHQTLVTGLYSPFHGIVGNDVYDTKWPSKLFSMDSQTSLNEAPWLVDWPEPIWVTLQKSGGLSGSLLWPLTDQPVEGDLPFQTVSEFTLLDGFSTKYPYTKRVDDLLWWLKNPRYHLDLVLAYFDEPDETGHAYGPNSTQVAKVVKELDSTLGRLLDGLDRLQLRDDVDIIITADHGMAQTSSSRTIPLNNFVNPSAYSYTHLSTFGFIYPKEGKSEEVYKNLTGAHEHLHVYWLSDVPAYLNFNHANSRTPPIVLVPDPYWYIVQKPNSSVISGNHGYATDFSDMHPFLIARGPSFRVGELIPEVYSVDVYPLMCSLLRVKPRPNNGSLERIASILKPELAKRLLAAERLSAWLPWFMFNLNLLWALVGLTSLLSILMMLMVCVMLRRRGNGQPSDPVVEDKFVNA
ncbi:unnamed protein product [Calicophoron daubneyi]|uniref:Uncharacterized protein n=1 Tax=Calicophoron daubneyi TaxID=300641 RepID=A0AAV2TUE0_CALDB